MGTGEGECGNQGVELKEEGGDSRTGSLSSLSVERKLSGEGTGGHSCWDYHFQDSKEDSTVYNADETLRSRTEMLCVYVVLSIYNSLRRRPKTDKFTQWEGKRRREQRESETISTSVRSHSYSMLSLGCLWGLWQWHRQSSYLYSYFKSSTKSSYPNGWRCRPFW